MSPPITSITALTYYPPSTVIDEEFGAPLARIDIFEEEGARAVMLAPPVDGVFRNDQDCPNVVIERRANGWAIFIHKDGGDCIGLVKISDDGECAMERDRDSSEMTICTPGEDAPFSIDRKEGAA